MQISKFDIILKKIKMKKLNYLLLTTLLLFFSFSINAQTADEIIENYIENTGGADNWAKVRSVKMNITVSQMGMEIPIEQYLSSEKTYSKISIQGQEIKQGVFDGETLWSTNFMSMKAENSDQEDVQNVKDELAEFPDPFLNYRTSGLETNLWTGNPTVALLEKAAGAIRSTGKSVIDDDYDFSKRDAYKWLRILPYQNMLGVRNVLQYMIDKNDLPRTSN